jgi:hypothetical protein
MVVVTTADHLPGQFGDAAWQKEKAVIDLAGEFIASLQQRTVCLASVDVIHGAPPEQSIAAWTANELAGLSGDKHVGVHQRRAPWRDVENEADGAGLATGGAGRSSP